MPTREEIEEIRTRTNIVDVISRYVTVRPSGANFVAICPFHPDKSPSLVISPEKGLYHCFGCGEGGDVFRFLMKVERIEFPEAVRRLAEEAGVQLQREETPASDRTARLRGLAERVARHYQQTLTTPVGRRAREYLIEARGLTEETLQNFRLGYAPPAGGDFLRAFAGEEDGLFQLGLLLEGRGTYRPFFRNRVIFPVADPQGRVVGFAGRALGEDEPKYLNTKGTPIFEKRRLLYGLPWARAGLAERGEALLVEGYTDVITAHQHGFTHAVASMGTAFTAAQARLLSRFVPRVLIAYDRDVAGRAATLRGLKQLLAAGLEVHIVVLPPGEDPDGLLRRGGREAFEALLKQAAPFPEFYVQALLEEHDARSLRGQEGILAEVETFLGGLTSPALRAQVLKELAGSLDIPMEDLRLRMKRRNATAIMGEDAPDRLKWGVEDHLMYLLLQGALPLERAVRELSPTDFSRFSRAMETLFALYREAGGPERLDGPDGQAFFNDWLGRLEPEDQAALRELAVSDRRDEDSERALAQLIGCLRLRSVEGRLKALTREIEAAERAHDREALQHLQAAQQEHLRERKQLLRQLGWGTFQGGG